MAQGRSSRRHARVKRRRQRTKKIRRMRKKDPRFTDRVIEKHVNRFTALESAKAQQQYLNALVKKITATTFPKRFMLRLLNALRKVSKPGVSFNGAYRRAKLKPPSQQR